ncbi:MAG: polysaccharide deacetylase family protein [Pseudomonadota bacterium]
MFLKTLLVGYVAISFSWISSSFAREIALTFDDAPTQNSILMTGNERTEKLIAALKSAKVPDALFFIKADAINADTRPRLIQYANAGFHLANHSFSHRSAHDISTDDYLADAYRAHLLIEDLPNFLPYHRFPFLHYGKDLSSIQYFRSELRQLGYQDGYTTIDNFDWYLSALITKAADEKRVIDYDKARDFYVQTMIGSIEFYDALAKKTLKRSPRHVLLLHENDAAALFVDDLVMELRKQGWKIISPQKAYQDVIAKQFPKTIFYKQGRVAAIAHSKGIPETQLRHESENIGYLDKLFKDAGVATNE